MRIEPTREYESYRRRVYRDVQEMWFYIRSKLEALKKDKSQLETKVKEVLSDLETREQVVLHDLEKMKETDGHDQWRQTEARDLSELVQTRLRDLQHPEDCSSAKKLVCSLNKCGYGCQIHKMRRSAALDSRYSDSSLRGVIQDIHLLSLTDHLVCTFSSNVSSFFLSLLI